VRRLLLLAFIWGWSFLFIKVAVEGMTPTTVACLRVTLGALVLHLWLRWRRVPPLADPTVRRWASVVGIVGSALPFTMLAWGEERISSALTAVLNASTPLFTAVAAAVIVQERLRAAQVVGLLVGFAGVSVAAGVGAADITDSSLAGGLAAVLAGGCYGLAFALMRAHLTGIPPAIAAAGQLTTAAIALAPFAIFTSMTDGFDPTWRRIGAIVLLGVVGTGLAYLLNYRIVAEVGATRASVVTYIIPIVAVVVGVLVLDETFERRVFVGGILIVAGVALVNGLARLPRRPPVAAVGALLLVVASTALLGCGGDDDGGDGGGSACGADQREAFDPASASHVLVGGPEPEYQTDPPTSGPHAPGTLASGVLADAMSRPEQVGSLEAGGVLLQHRDLTADELAELESLAGEGVAVVPNADLPDRVVATAWLFKLSCEGIDVDALRAFVDDHLGEGPGADG
jgi:drug/metabolite transporter (DMT)-like permease